MGISSTVFYTCAKALPRRRIKRTPKKNITLQPQNLYRTGTPFSLHNYRKDHCGKNVRKSNSSPDSIFEGLGSIEANNGFEAPLAFQGIGCVSGRKDARGRQPTISGRWIGHILWIYSCWAHLLINFSRKVKTNQLEEKRIWYDIGQSMSKSINHP